MVPHMSGTTIDAQIRYANGTKNILASYFSGKHDYKPEDLIVIGGKYSTRVRRVFSADLIIQSCCGANMSCLGIWKGCKYRQEVDNPNSIEATGRA